MGNREPRLRAMWVRVVDDKGRARLEERWVEPAPAVRSTEPVGVGQAA